MRSRVLALIEPLWNRWPNFFKIGEFRKLKPFSSAWIAFIFGKLAKFFIYKRSSAITEAVCCNISEIVCSRSSINVDLRCPLAAAVVLAAAEKEYTTATAQNIKFGIEDIEGFAWIVISFIRPCLTSILLWMHWHMMSVNQTWIQIPLWLCYHCIGKGKLTDNLHQIAHINANQAVKLNSCDTLSTTAQSVSISLAKQARENISPCVGRCDRHDGRNGGQTIIPRRVIC